MPRNKFNIVLPEGHRWEDEPVYGYNTDGPPADFRWECKDCRADFFIWVDEGGNIKTELKTYSYPLCTDEKKKKVEVTTEPATEPATEPPSSSITIIHKGKTVVANSVKDIERAMQRIDDEEDLDQYGWGL